eukprot:3917828-Pleurochrysis_carterae.AAC.1
MFEADGGNTCGFGVDTVVVMVASMRGASADAAAMVMALAITTGGVESEMGVAARYCGSLRRRLAGATVAAMGLAASGLVVAEGMLASIAAAGVSAA